MDPFMADDGKRIMHAHLTINGGHLMLNDDFPEYGGARRAPPGSVTLHLQVTDADAAWNRALAAGGDGKDAARRPILGRPLRPADRPVRLHLVDRRSGQQAQQGQTGASRRLGHQVTGRRAEEAAGLRRGRAGRSARASRARSARAAVGALGPPMRVLTQPGSSTAATMPCRFTSIASACHAMFSAALDER